MREYEEMARFATSTYAAAALETVANRPAKVLEVTDKGLLKVLYRGAEIFVENSHPQEPTKDEWIHLGLSDGQLYGVGPNPYGGG